MSAKFLKVPAQIDRWIAGDNDRRLGRALADQAIGFEVAQGLANGDQADAEMVSDRRFLRQFAADGIAAIGNRFAQHVGELAVERAVRPPQRPL